MEKTQYLNLVLPSETDLPYESVNIFREDFGYIDTAIKSDRDEITTLNSNAEKIDLRTSELESTTKIISESLQTEVDRASNAFKIVEVPDWIFDRSGYAQFSFSQLGIPVGDGEVYYPDISVISGALYFCQLVSIDTTGFSVQIYRPDGTRGCDVEDDVVAGMVASGEISAGQSASDSVVRLKMRFFLPLTIVGQGSTKVNTVES